MATLLSTIGHLIFWWPAWDCGNHAWAENPVDYCLSCLLPPQPFNFLMHNWNNCPPKLLVKPAVCFRVITEASLVSANATASVPAARNASPQPATTGKS